MTNGEENGKKWSLEDDEDDEEETMDYEMSEKAHTDAEKSFKPLAKTNDKEDDGLVGKSLPQRTLFKKTDGTKNTTTTTTTTTTNGVKAKPKTMMRFGMGKGLTMKKKSVVTPMDTTPLAPSKQPTKTTNEMDVDDADVDPLEAYMMDVTAEARKIKEEDQKRMEELKSETRPNLDDEDGKQDQDDEDKSDDSDSEDILA